MGSSLDAPKPPKSAGQKCCSEQWEAAYLRFETPEQEIAKFRGRLVSLGAEAWPKDAQIVDLFCGRGNGLRALEQLGFERLEGVDLSGTLLAEYKGPARGYVCDCRELPFADATKDILIVQGGLHHLEAIPDDLEQVLLEVSRVLRPTGRLVVVEPWLTPLLSAIHFLSRRPLLRQVWSKLDAFATMTEHEIPTYEQWLEQPETILNLARAHFETESLHVRAGKLKFVGRKR